MATVEALEIPADELVLNRTSLQQLRQNNRHQSEKKSEFIEQVISLKLSYCYFEYVVLFSFFMQ